MKQEYVKQISRMLFCRINCPFKTKILMIFDKFIYKYFKASQNRFRTSDV